MGKERGKDRKQKNNERKRKRKKEMEMEKELEMVKKERKRKGKVQRGAMLILFFCVCFSVCFPCFFGMFLSFILLFQRFLRFCGLFLSIRYADFTCFFSFTLVSLHLLLFSIVFRFCGRFLSIGYMLLVSLYFVQALCRFNVFIWFTTFWFHFAGMLLGSWQTIRKTWLMVTTGHRQIWQQNQARTNGKKQPETTPCSKLCSKRKLHHEGNRKQSRQQSKNSKKQ